MLRRYVFWAWFALAFGDVVIEKITKERGLINESPYWDEEAQKLYWLDIRGRTVSSYDGKTVNTVAVNGGPVSGIVPVAGRPGYFIVGIKLTVSLMYWDGQDLRIEPLATLPRGDRVNDAKCDRRGRYWIGTMGPQNSTGGVEPLQGSLYMVTPDNYDSPAEKITPTSISNGLTWSRDDKTFFYIDSPTRKIYAYDFDIRSGELGERRVLFSLDDYEIPGFGDGMTIDSKDNLWVAAYGAGAVLKIDPKTGALLRQVRMPTIQVSSVIWGGKNLDILYVTTGGQYMTDEQLEADPNAGHVFAVKGLGARGLKSEKFNSKKYVRDSKKNNYMFDS